MVLIQFSNEFDSGAEAFPDPECSAESFLKKKKKKGGRGGEQFCNDCSGTKEPTSEWALSSVRLLLPLGSPLLFTGLPPTAGVQEGSRQSQNLDAFYCVKGLKLGAKKGSEIERHLQYILKVGYHTVCRIYFWK